MKPGITGRAQIHGRALYRGRSGIELDLWYVRHHDWKTDLLILLRTPLALLGGTYKVHRAAGRRLRRLHGPAVPSRAVTAVLFTCAGQRVDIVTASAAPEQRRSPRRDQLAPALYHADHRAIVPRVDDSAMSAALRDLVALHDVRLIVPLDRPRPRRARA